MLDGLGNIKQVLRGWNETRWEKEAGMWVEARENELVGVVVRT